MASGLAAAATVGRAPERDRIETRLAELAAGRGGLVLLSGEPGIGKTRLAVDGSAAAERHGYPVAWGRCPEAGAAPAFWPWVQVVREVIGRRGAAAARHRLGAAADVLALAEGGTTAARGPTSAELAASSRFRLLDGVLRLLGGAGPLLVVLEDVHRADELSAALLRQLGAAAARLPVLVVATFRPGDVALGGPVAAALAELAGLPWCDDLPLGPLADDDAVRLVAALPGTRLDEPAVRAVVDRAGGNPLFMQQLARAPTSGAVLPLSLRELVRARVAALPVQSRELLAALAVGGRETDVARAAAACGVPVTEAWARLAAPVAQGLVNAEPGGRTAVFAHALLQEVLYADLDAARRAELHERYAALLAPAAADDPALHAARADHALRAARGGRGIDCVGPLRAAAGAAAARLAFAEAARLLSDALAEVGDRPAEQAAVLLELGSAEVHAGRPALARAHLERAADLAAESADPALLAAAALGIGDCIVTVGQVDRGLVARLRQALDALGDRDPAVRVRLLARLAVELYWWRGEQARAVSADALAAAEELPDDPSTVGEALWARLFTLRGPDRLTERLQIGRRLVDVAWRQDDVDVECRGRVWWLPELLRAGELPAYRANVARLGLLAERSGQPLHQWYAELFAAQRSLVEGDVADAAPRIEAAAAIAARLGTGAGEIYRLAQLLVLRRDVGGLADLLDPVQAVADRYPALVTLRVMVAVLQAELGFPVEAADGLARIATDGFAAVPPDSLWTTTLCYAADVAHLVGDERTAAAAAGRLAPYRGTCAVHGIPVAWGAVDRAVGLGRLTAGDRPGAVAALRSALDRHERWGFRALAVRTRVDLAEALGGGPDGRSLAGLAAAQAADLGLPRLAARAAAVAESLAGPAPLTGPGGTLSPRETEVLALLAAGVSNAGIAARLVLSVNTVERHVRNVYTKLGVTNRAEAAALATRAQAGVRPAGSRPDPGFR